MFNLKAPVISGGSIKLYSNESGWVSVASKSTYFEMASKSCLGISESIGACEFGSQAYKIDVLGS